MRTLSRLQEMEVKPGIVAHRGGSLLWPENSLAAVRGSLALGADGIEIEVHLTRGGKVVVHHDPRLGRTVHGHRAIQELDHHALRALPLVEHDDERVPLLQDVVDLVGDSHAVLSVEVKNTTTGGRYPRIADFVLQALTDPRLHHNVLVHSFDWRVLERLQRLDGCPAIAANLGDRAARRYGSPVRALGAAARRNFVHINVDHRLLSRRFMSRARALGMEVTTWTPNTPDELVRVMDLGVDYIATDRPDLALDLRRARLHIGEAATA
jgi:glycerophosphoryl diester phosphodiesterase